MEWTFALRLGQGGRKEERKGKGQEQHGNSGYNNCDNDDLDLSTEKKMESLIMSLEVFCYKENLPIKQFFDSIHSIFDSGETWCST
jgi:hypothetical protein